MKRAGIVVADSPAGAGRGGAEGDRQAADARARADRGRANRRTPEWAQVSSGKGHVARNDRTDLRTTSVPSPPSFLHGANADYIEQLQARYRARSGSASTRAGAAFFRGLGDAPSDAIRARRRPELGARRLAAGADRRADRRARPAQWRAGAGQSAARATRSPPRPPRRASPSPTTQVQQRRRSTSIRAHDDHPRLPHPRPPRRRPRPAGPRPRRGRHPELDPEILRLHRGRHGPPDLHRQRAGPRDRLDARRSSRS